MRIAINTLGSSSLKVGVGNYVIHLVHELAKIDKQNQYYIIANKKNARFFSTKNPALKILITPNYTAIKPLRILWEQLLLPFIIKKNEINLLHSPGFIAPLIKTSASIVTIHDMTFFSHPQCHTRFKRAYFTTLIPHTIRNADAISADSENTKQDIIAHLATTPSKIHTIHLGIDTNFQPLDKKSAQQTLQKKYNLNKPFILFVGMIEPRKNLNRLIDAYVSLKTATQLVIVGKKGWHMDSFFKKIKDLRTKEIVLTGYVPDEDLPFFYTAADAFVYPSLYEGFGLPVIEAMACGCPVVTSNNSSLKEIAEEAALLINPENTQELADAMKKIIHDKQLRKTLIQKGLKQAQQFTWKKTAEKTLELYHQVAAKNI